MATTHYDIIILGESLAARIAAVLLAKEGRRVLLARLPSPAGESATPPWLTVNLQLERLLDLLGGRSCLASATPFQILTDDVRWTVHGVNDLLDELRREFPNESEQVNSLLAKLKNFGERFERFLCDYGELPLTDWRSRWRYFYKLRLQGFSRRRLFRSLAHTLRDSLSPRAAEALATLFSGLSLAPVEKLTFAEGALLWRGFSDSRGISTVALNTLLTHRLEQFQVDTALLGKGGPTPSAAGQMQVISLDDGRRCSAGYFLFGSPDASALLPSTHPAAAVSAPARACQFSIVEGTISPLLAPVVLLGGAPALRLTLPCDSSPGPSRILCQPVAPAADASDDHYRQRLSSLMPFASLRGETLAENVPDKPLADRRLNAFPGAINPLRIEKNLFWCCGSQVLPSLGSVGECMVAMAIFNYLRRQGSN